LNSKIVLHVALLGLTMLAAPMARANTFNVDTTVDVPDDGLSISSCHTQVGCSLRAAIMKANQVGGTNIVKVPAGTYTLTIRPSGSNGDSTGDLNITTSIAIVGQDAEHTIINGNAIDRVFDISVGQFVGLTNVTIRNGSLQSANGAGVRNAGILTIAHCVIENNFILTGDGAGIYSTGSLDITRSIVRKNNTVGGGNGGGIAISGTAVLRESAIDGNVARNGGGIYVINSSQYAYVINSTISGNIAFDAGGGIHAVDLASSDVIGLYSTSVIGNDAGDDSGGKGQGGGVYAKVDGGARFIVDNTLIANNTINGRDAFNDCVGAIEVYGNNLFSRAVPPDCAMGGDGSAAWAQISLETLGPLQDNGGPTPTHALLQNSEGIDGATNQGCVDQNHTALTTDQRGKRRVLGVRCDIGAFEYDPASSDRIFGNDFE